MTISLDHDEVGALIDLLVDQRPVPVVLVPVLLRLWSLAGVQARRGVPTAPVPTPAGVPSCS